MEKKTQKKSGGKATAKKATGRKGAAQSAAKSSPAKAARSTGRKASGARQTQTGSAGAQGSTSMSQQRSPMFGGTKQVAIEEAAMTSRGGRKQGPELYPFGELPESRLEGTVIVGPSFFIPNSDEPKKIIASGRKRHKPAKKVFLTRQMEAEVNGKMVPGVRVWLAPADYKQ